jgi:hypothetical protein
MPPFLEHILARRHLFVNTLHFLISFFPSPKEINEDALNNDLGANHILRALVFELGNSVNKNICEIQYSNYPSAEAYARAAEKAEFETQTITIPIFDHGVKHCNWSASAFKHSDLEELKEIAYNATDEHYQLYIRHYEESYACNVITYYMTKLWNQLCSKCCVGKQLELA